ncbi:sulfite exporter TauE/SafE family protein [Nonomuraea angiospora]|uniref:Probable membrane transporter protein n=1 Tax=Nonomuraea angiospora TaxID=46172 RepID=A0ABR9MEG3_9ACTN|nr:sulfite exporter TauE/SafE family protein [Nonomuraea angiospora]MBE1591303.1 putative membrane protein YfcA [Nonomuraea angiospora]MDX3104836.1 sulfite exporter TauE/SafE family protein [Nonomuraea angiospora]
MTDLLFMLGAGLLAGVVNALAGGGTLISFPALLALGYPSLTASVTNAVALWPGYLGGVLGYRAELRGQRRRAAALSITTVLGAGVGSALLLLTPGRLFESLVPWLVAFASLALLAQPWLRRLFGGEADGPPSKLVYAGVFLGGCYGAYFNGGMGVLLLTVLGMFLHDNLHRVNAVRATLALVISTVSVVAFSLFGPVQWQAVAVIAPASLAGGFLGTRLARLMSAKVLRGVVVAFGLGVAVALALR